MSELVVTDVSHTFSDTGRGCSHVSFTAWAGELTVLTAPSGAGKSTALAVIAGVLARHGGTVTFDGRQLERGEAALVLQGAQVFERLTA